MLKRGTSRFGGETPALLKGDNFMDVAVGRGGAAQQQPFQGFLHPLGI